MLEFGRVRPLRKTKSGDLNESERRRRETKFFAPAPFGPLLRPCVAQYDSRGRTIRTYYALTPPQSNLTRLVRSC